MPAATEVHEEVPVRPYGRVVLACVVATAGLTGCDGSSNPRPTESQPAPVTIAECSASVSVPSDTTLVVPSSSVPPTAVIRAGSALSIDVPRGSTLGLGAPARSGDGGPLCRASATSAGTVVLVGREPGFVRVVVVPASGEQRVVNVQVTV